MLSVEFSPVQFERFGKMVEDVRTYGYGISCGWQNTDQLMAVKKELESFKYSNEHIPYEDVLYLPEHSRAIFAGIGNLALKTNLRPRQALIVKQKPSEIGRTHVDKNVTVSIILPLHRTRTQMLQPGRFGIPAIDEHTGEFTLEDAHTITVPAGTLLGYAGNRTAALPAIHRVDNPSPVSDRYSLVLGCQ